MSLLLLETGAYSHEDTQETGFFHNLKSYELNTPFSGNWMFIAHYQASPRWNKIGLTQHEKGFPFFSLKDEITQYRWSLQVLKTARQLVKYIQNKKKLWCLREKADIPLTMRLTSIPPCQPLLFLVVSHIPARQS